MELATKFATDIQIAITNGFTSAINDMRITFTTMFSDFLRYTMRDICDIGCVIVVGYIVYVAFRIILGDTKTFDKVVDKCLFGGVAYMILRMCSIIYFQAGGAILR